MGGGGGGDVLEGKGPQRRPQKRVDRRLEEVAKAVGGGYCRLQMPLKLALGVRQTVAGHRLGALEGGGYPHPPSNALGVGGRAMGSARQCGRVGWAGEGGSRNRVCRGKGMEDVVHSGVYVHATDAQKGKQLGTRADVGAHKPERCRRW